MREWKQLGIVEEGAMLEVSGSNIWSGKWVALNASSVMLPHPTYAAQNHNFRLYRFENGDTNFDFAAAELSPNVWGFYVAS